MKVFKKPIFTFILGFILAVTIGVVAANVNSNSISFEPNDENWNVTTVQGALNDLYDIGTNGGINRKLSELKAGTNTITNNTNKTLYVALLGYTSVSTASDIIATRTQIDSITGANSQEIFYSFDSNTNFGIRVYKLTNCGQTVTVTSRVSNSGDGKIIFFGN